MRLGATFAPETRKASRVRERTLVQRCLLTPAIKKLASASSFWTAAGVPKMSPGSRPMQRAAVLRADNITRLRASGRLGELLTLPIMCLRVLVVMEYFRL